MTVISVPKSKARDFSRSLSENPLIELIRVRVNNETIEYEIDSPDFMTLLPSYAVEL